MTESTPRKVRLMSALLLVGTFAAGSLAGAGAQSYFGRPFPPHRHHPGSRPLFPPLPLEQLDLSQEQSAQIRAIVDRHRPELEAILKETFPKVRAVNEGVTKEIRAVLTEAQQKRLEQLERDRPRPPGGHFGPPGVPPPPPPEP